ncbi:FlgD immunoglobulin-like domain containing protein, partial [Candidatus Latescibacterota bacterium]
TIWQIYNHGFVVKTPSKTFGFDLRAFPNSKDFMDLADILDAYFISHWHIDHKTERLIDAMTARDKPVVGPAESPSIPIKMYSGDTLTIAGLTVIAHYGLHGDVPLRQFEVVTSEGLKFLHTGDNQTSVTLPPVEDIDVMLLNGWINESGATSFTEGVRIAINKMRPETTLPGHIMELQHFWWDQPPIPYRDVIAADNGTLASDYHMLAWGERYHYNNTSNDSILPNAVENLNYSILADTITFSWELPQASSDGDTASFYRVVINDTEDFFTTNKEYHYTDFTSELENVKVYSYDDCGNQSLTYSEIQDLENIVYITFKVTVPDITPSDDVIFIYGTFNQWDPGPSQTGVDDMDHDLFMTSVGGDQWQITLPFTASETIEYKYTRGSWDSVEKGYQGEEISNHMLIVLSQNYIQEDTVATWADTQTTVEEKVEVSFYYDLAQNYPNPTNPSTHISFKVPRLSRVTIKIFDIFGREVRSLIDGNFEPGTHSVLWDGLNNSGLSISSGIYFYQMRSEDFVKVRKALLLR